MRIISLQKYNAHTEPLFKTLQLLKVNDILKVQQLKFYFSLIHNKLPIYFDCFNFSRNYHFHNYFTRLSNHFHVVKVKHTFATKCLRFSLPTLLNCLPSCITDKYFTHSINGFTNYVKNYYLTSYSSQCLVPNCYVCNHWTLGKFIYLFIYLLFFTANWKLKFTFEIEYTKTIIYLLIFVCIWNEPI